jgi:diguanylate cyclase (GGDEF)-like protein/PAS domain S-box-containing protein
VYLVLVVSGALTYLVLPGDVPKDVLYLSLAASGLVAVAVGIRRQRPVYPLPWYLAAAGLTVFFVADVYFYVQRLADHVQEATLPNNVMYLSSYPLLIAALLLLLRRREPLRDRVSLIDASLIAVSLGLLYWVYLVVPQHNSTTGALVAVTYLVVDLLLVAVALRLLVAPGAHRPAFYLVLIGVVALCVTDVVWAWRAGHGGYRPGGVLDEGWLGYYCLWGAAALHPSMASLAEPNRRRRDEQHLTPLRLGALVVAVLISPLVLLEQSRHPGHDEVPVVAVVSLVLFLLVLARVAVIVQVQAASAHRERTLRSAAAALVGTTDRGRRNEVALDAARALLGGTGHVIRLVGDADGQLCLVAARGGGPAQLRVPLDAALLSRVLETGEPGGAQVVDLPTDVLHALSLTDARGELLASPVVIDGSPAGALLVVCEQSPPAGLHEALDTLAAQLALALQAAALSEALYQRQSQARFQALVQRSSDAILLIDADTVVQYQSPAVRRLLGVDDEALLGGALLGLVHPEDMPRALEAFADVGGTLPAPLPLGLRLRRRDGGWRDVEIVIDDLREDENVQGILVTVRDATERKRFERQLRHQAFHDPLTGLANRALLQDRAEQALRVRDRDRTSLAVVVLDLDDFKTINDSLGHAAGDSLLVAVAERLRGLVRPGDTVSRLGGDEFALLLDGLPSEDVALLVVDRALAHLAEAVVVEGKEVFVTASAGVALATPGQSPTTDELLRNADMAMYVAKRGGKGRLDVYEPQMHRAAIKRLELRADLQRALDHKEFALLYQPIISFSTMQVVGVEALVRWQHPQRGLLPPADFLDLSEETGLVLPLGEWVLDAALDQAARWRDAGRSLTVAINLSQRQLQRPQLEDDLLAALQRSQVDPHMVTLEITETAAMSDPEVTVRTLHRLRALGVRLAIDDFGTGYSSLSWLRQLPLDVVKIDKEFVDGIARRSEDRVLVGAIVGLARNLGLSTVAEGMERPDQLAQVIELGCDFGQGYHFARPMTAEAVGRLIDHGRSPGLQSVG